MGGGGSKGGGKGKGAGGSPETAKIGEALTTAKADRLVTLAERIEDDAKELLAQQNEKLKAALVAGSTTERTRQQASDLATRVEQFKIGAALLRPNSSLKQARSIAKIIRNEALDLHTGPRGYGSNVWGKGLKKLKRIQDDAERVLNLLG